MYTIAIDCGASFLKGACLIDGRPVRLAQRRAPAVSQSDNLTAPSQIRALLPLVRDMLRELAADEKELTLCLSNEMHGFLLARENGEPVTDYISWQRELGAMPINGLSPVDELGAAPLADDIAHSGMPLRGGLPSCNLLYLKRKNLLPKENVYFYTLGDYLLRALSNQQPVCHPTNGAATGLMDLQTGTWNPTLASIAGSDAICFPTIGQDIVEFDLDGVRFHALPAVGDQQAALLGAGLTRQDELSFNLGTGAQVSMVTDRLICSPQHQTRPYFGGRYLKTIPHLPSGRALNVYFRFVKELLASCHVELTDETIYEFMLGAADNCSGSGLCCDLSFFENPITPHTKGSLTRIGEYELTPGNVMSAILDQMGENFCWAADMLAPDPAQVGRILFSGGIARRIEPLRRRILAHYPKNTRYSLAENETLLGLYAYSRLPRRGGEER